MRACLKSVCVCMHECVRVHAYIQLFVCMSVCVYV